MSVSKRAPSSRVASRQKRETRSASREPLQISVTRSSPTTQRAEVLVVGAFADGSLSPAARAIDEASKGKIAAVLRREDLGRKAGSTLMLYDLPGTAAERVLLVSLGEPAELDDKRFRAALEGAAKALGTGRARDAAVALADVEVPGRTLAWRVQQAARILADGAYRFDAPKQTNGEPAELGPRSIVLLVPEDPSAELEAAARRGQVIAGGMALARDLGNLPGNVCNPEYLADTARALGEELGINVDVLERDEMAKLGMQAALSVGRASDHPCKFIVMDYRGGERDAKPIVLVGKGVTFDTGGISLKPGDDLDMMKYDMCGAAAVFGAMQTAARLRLPINVVGIVNAVENMPGGNATRPGDVVTSMAGLTIEVLNTDAEGRLGLCDALTYAERFDPACVVDVATLTGACVIALGNVASGLYANDDDLAEELLACADDSGDFAWRMPLWDEYLEQLDSNFADMSNIGGRPAGSVTAACFLGRFTKGYRWAHFDIAGTNARSGAEKGATGRPVPLLAEFLLRRSGSARAAA
ncbi:MAG TPA: leucyl aminopeptidase [Gammaproteobacteria bacterium]